MEVEVDCTEYCEDREIIQFAMKDGLVPTKDGWKFFHQILFQLLHIDSSPKNCYT